MVAVTRVLILEVSWKTFQELWFRRGKVVLNKVSPAQPLRFTAERTQGDVRHRVFFTRNVQGGYRARAVQLEPRGKCSD
jgi:hypothetical protein